MSKAREIPWPEEFSDLKRIEELMICGICYEFIDTSVMTPCSHNYCSLCIRKYLHYKTQCPACFHNVFEKDLYINRSMDGMIEHYFKIREKLITLIENRVVYNKVIQYEPEQIQDIPVRPVRSSPPKSPAQTLETKLIESKLRELTKSPTMNSPLASTSKYNPCSPTIASPKFIPSIAKIFNTPKRKDSVSTQPPINTKTVSCPVCKVDISELHINVHLDACLQREINEKSDIINVNAVKRPPLPKLVLRVMKDTELRKKMKELGLSAQGDRRALENRFTRYSTIYNAECDKREPRSIPELIKQCEMEEKQERKMDMFLVSSAAAPAGRLHIERNAKEEKIEEAHKNYRAANKSSFDKLIEEVRNRRKMEKSKHKNCEIIGSANKEDDESTSLNIKQDEKNSNSSSKQDDTSDSKSTKTKPPRFVKKVSEENLSGTDESNTYNPSNEIAFQDSDSDESCPLQHYVSDGQLKYFSNNLSDASPSTSTASSPIKRLQKTKNEDNKNNKLVKPSISSTANNMHSNPYEIATDESSENDIPTSPVINKKSTNRKRVKLSNTKSNKSDSLENDARQAEARELCNSILQDFTFDDSDDSLNEFAMKYNNEDMKKVVAVKNTMQKIIASSCDNSVPESYFIDKFVQDALTENDPAKSTDASSSRSIPDSSSETKKRKSREKQNSSLQLNCIKEGKENDATSANERSPSPMMEIACRPVRKRNRPSRFANTESCIKEDGMKTPKKITEDSQDSGSPEHIKSSTSDGSLKRRRGRAKVNNKEQTVDETQTPPKRPVRRRQAVSDQN